MARCTALQVANYLVFLTSNVFDDLTNLKLNKMLYYAQGHYLKKTGEQLFSDPIEAWDFGPVVNVVYQKYKDHDKIAIKAYDSEMAEEMPQDVAEFLIDIARVYGQYTAASLVNKTHAPGGPWDRVYRKDEYHITIPPELIKRYFESNERELEPVRVSLTEEDYIDRRGDDGVLVLPREWDDEEI